MSGTQRSRRKAPQTWDPLTNRLMSLEFSTLCGSLWELSCNRAATSRHGEGKGWLLLLRASLSFLYSSAILASLMETMDIYLQKMCKHANTHLVQCSCPQRWKFYQFSRYERIFNAPLMKWHLVLFLE